MHLMFETESSSGRVEEVVAELVSRYGSFEQLDQRVQLSRCSDPQMVDDLMIWRSINAGDVVIKETLYYKNADLVNVLTPRRVELLEMLRKERRPISVTMVSKRTRRDYKNVYDDLKVLIGSNVVNRTKIGREVLVSTNVRKIVIAFEDNDIYY